MQRNTRCPKRLLCKQLAIQFLNIVKLKLVFKGIILPEGIPCMPSTTLGRLCWCFPPLSNTAYSFTGCYRIVLDVAGVAERKIKLSIQLLMHSKIFIPRDETPKSVVIAIPSSITISMLLLSDLWRCQHHLLETTTER